VGGLTAAGPKSGAYAGLGVGWGEPRSDCFLALTVGAWR
jgi:hypothetical protein